MAETNSQSTVNAACLIHGSGYDWYYVDKLYNMLCRNLSVPVTLHVYTEPERAVPAHYVKHELTDWGFGGPKKSWWYKMQLFNSAHFAGPLLYFDLDVVIVNNIDWICQLNPEHFWTVKDFKYLWKISSFGINSSMMWWNTVKYSWIWENFNQQNIQQIVYRYRGDQDYLTDVLANRNLRYVNPEHVISWRWQASQGGYDFQRKTWYRPGAGTDIKNSSILVFHGNPKPHEIQDPVIQQHWC